MNTETLEKLTAVFGGLVLGERTSWTSMFESSFLMPFWTRRKRREMDSQHEADSLLSINLPFALNQLTQPLLPGPGPRAEWFAFQLHLMRHGGGASYSLARATEAWRGLASHEGPLRLTISQEAALRNLRAAKLPPVTGHDNPHYFDDAACFRSLAIAVVYANDLAGALEATRQDAGITNAEDGVWGAQAVTAALIAALQGTDAKGCVDAAVRLLPDGSWISEAAAHALSYAEDSQTIFGLIEALEANVINRAYNYGDAAPETVPAALAILQSTHGDPERALLAALALPRMSASLAPLLGALCGALGTVARGAPTSLHTPLRGIALPFLAGTTLYDMLSGRTDERTSYGSHTL